MKIPCGVRSAKCEVKDTMREAPPRAGSHDDETKKNIRIPNFNFRICRISFRTPHPALRTSSGFTYVALLAAIVIIGISLGAAGKYWSAVMTREKEEELLFRGNQYRQAVERYYLAKAPNAFPADIDQLLSDDRFPQAKRHLRQKYKDPITGEDFELFRDQTKGNRILGVFSSSDKEPLKQTDFPEENKDFEGKTKYSEWKFLSTAQQQGISGVKTLPTGSRLPGSK